MRRDYQRLQDILDALDSVERMIAGCKDAEFLNNETLCYAIAQRLTVVGEAASRLSTPFQKFANVSKHRPLPNGRGSAAEPRASASQNVPSGEEKPCGT